MDGVTSQGTRARQRPVDMAATIALLIGHGVVAVLTYLVVGLSVMSTDSCSYRACGSQVWAEVGVQGVLFGGIVLVVADLVICIRRMSKGRRAWFVPLLFYLAQVALAAAGWGMVSLAGPV